MEMEPLQIGLRLYGLPLRCSHIRMIYKQLHFSSENNPRVKSFLFKNQRRKLATKSHICPVKQTLTPKKPFLTIGDNLQLTIVCEQNQPFW